MVNGTYIFNYIASMKVISVTSAKTRDITRPLYLSMSGAVQWEKYSLQLLFKEGLKKLLRETTDSRDFEAEALAMAKLVKVIRKEIFEWAPFHFSAAFHQIVRKIWYIPHP